MKYIKYSSLFLCLLMVLAVACNGKADPNLNPNPNPDNTANSYDIWIATGEGTSSTQKQDAHVVISIKDLLKGEYDIVGTGVETLASGMTPFVVYRDGFYYSISRDGNFGKYQITNKSVNTIKIFPIEKILDRRFAYAWLDNRTLLLIGSAGKKQVMNWVKIDVIQMKPVAEGVLDLPAPNAGEQFTSNGVLAYRKGDDKLLFFYAYNPDKKSSMTPVEHEGFYFATIDAKTMKTVANVEEKRLQQPASTSFGEIRNKKGFFTPSGDYYLACSNLLPGSKSSTQQYSSILRVKANATDFDKDYRIDALEKSKIVSLYHLTANKAIAQYQNPLYATGTNNWKEEFVFFWTVIDLDSRKQMHIKDIPFSTGGNYTELIVAGKDYAILGASLKEHTQFYKYDYKDGKVSEGAKLKAGHYADKIVVTGNKR